MLIVGAKGFAKEVLEICYQNKNLKNIVFFDDISIDMPSFLYNKFPVLRNEQQVIDYFAKYDNEFTIGIGNPVLRKKIYDKFILLGGKFSSTISTNAYIGNFGNQIGEGCNIMLNVAITNDVNIGKGVIINQLSSIGHDVIVGDFVEICPNVSISGNCIIGNNSFIGTGAIILPKVRIGENVTIGAGAVVSKDLPDNCVAVGIPAKIIKQN